LKTEEPELAAEKMEGVKREREKGRGSSRTRCWETYHFGYQEGRERVAYCGRRTVINGELGKFVTGYCSRADGDKI
jgi:hypothetical protein